MENKSSRPKLIDPFLDIMSANVCFKLSLNFKSGIKVLGMICKMFINTLLVVVVVSKV